MGFNRFCMQNHGKFDGEKSTRSAKERTGFPGRAAAISPKQRVRLGRLIAKKYNFKSPSHVSVS